VLKTIDILAKGKELVGKKFKCTKSITDTSLKGQVAKLELFGNDEGPYYGLMINRCKASDLTGFEEWELAQEPVNFMEAVNSGKLIRYKSWNIYNSLKEVISILGVKSEDAQREMINGKWFIKED